MYSETNFRRGIFNAKMLNSNFYLTPSGEVCLGCPSTSFHQDPFIPSKVIQLFNPDRQTDTHTPIHIHMSEIFQCPFLLPFTSLHLLCTLRSWRIIFNFNFIYHKGPNIGGQMAFKALLEPGGNVIKLFLSVNYRFL